ncbi:sulfotransferase [Maritimibacter dapengensis]|uniref:Sulfotransferase n=1 Tax=Maritimibacter dapengensis TaxID=2836868 RepID=A0ABS6SYQ4_9RHOB|nr:sulfotransferase [Maritimibacter dapengensis]MBV7378097.1 sulfotransferase [Maritimibacter dapengensis]
MDALNYGFLDRAVHRLAFKVDFGQEMLRDMEERLYGAEIAKQPVDSPIFVTSLARAGTTLLLEILAKHPDVVTHTYRDMPFVLSPLMWRKLSGRFRVDLARRERSHSDGMLVDADSPEAFEEVMWLRECPELFGEDGIALGPETGDRIAEPKSDLIRRLIASRGPADAPRYVSKNNANIARLSAIRDAFPDARFVVPLRAPLDHAMSLHRQHMRYLDIHAESGFASDYMRDIGHFEFGDLHRPILFPGMDAVIEAHDPKSLDYWLAYWICAYRHIAERDDVCFVDMERFTRAPDVAELLKRLGLRADEATEQAGTALVLPIKRYDRPDGVSDALFESADALFQSLR